MRGMLGVVKNLILRNSRSRVPTQRLARIWVYVEPREIAARNIQPNPVPRSKYVADRIHNDVEAIHLTRIQKLGVSLESR